MPACRLFTLSSRLLVLLVSLFSSFVSLSFSPVCPSLCLWMYLSFCFRYLLCGFGLLRCLPFCFLSTRTYKITFCFPGVLGSEVSAVVFFFLALFCTPRVACKPAIYKYLCILLCVSFLALFISCSLVLLIGLLFSSLLFVSISISVFRRRVVSFILSIFLLGRT